jgi:uncharacterized protein (DUF433 family)
MAIKDPPYNGRIVVDPGVLGGKPVVKGTRIPVELVLKRLAQDLDVASLFKSYPRLTRDDVKSCLEYAQSMVEGESHFAAPPIRRTGSSRR